MKKDENEIFNTENPDHFRFVEMKMNQESEENFVKIFFN